MDAAKRDAGNDLRAGSTCRADAGKYKSDAIVNLADIRNAAESMDAAVKSDVRAVTERREDGGCDRSGGDQDRQGAGLHARRHRERCRILAIPARSRRQGRQADRAPRTSCADAGATALPENHRRPAVAATRSTSCCVSAPSGRAISSRIEKWWWPGSSVNVTGKPRAFAAEANSADCRLNSGSSPPPTTTRSGGLLSDSVLERAQGRDLVRAQRQLLVEITQRDRLEIEDAADRNAGAEGRMMRHRRGQVAARRPAADDDRLAVETKLGRRGSRDS